MQFGSVKKSPSLNGSPFLSLTDAEGGGGEREAPEELHPGGRRPTGSDYCSAWRLSVLLPETLKLFTSLNINSVHVQEEQKKEGKVKSCNEGNT